MTAIIYRLCNCLAALALFAWLFPGSIELSAVMWGTLMLTVLYILLRPLALSVILPFNIVLLGTLTPFTDALFIWWTSSWVYGFSVGYWQSVLIALFVSLLFLPYSWWKERKLTQLP